MFLCSLSGTTEFCTSEEAECVFSMLENSLMTNKEGH